MRARFTIYLLICALAWANATLPAQAQDGGGSDGSTVTNDSSSSDDNTETILVGLFTVIILVLGIVAWKSDRARSFSEVGDDAYAFDDTRDEGVIGLGDEGLSLRARF